MLFTSFSFVIFLSVLFGLYYSSPKRYRWNILLVFSYIFYAFSGIQYVLLLAYISAVSYFSAIHLHKKQTLGSFEIFSLIFAILIPLLFFKYTGFLTENINIVLSAFSSATELTSMKIVLPLGISFYTFAAVGYVVDTLKNKYEPFKNPLHLAAGLSFFPCLVSGPIERQNNLVPQVLKGSDFNYHNATYGLKQIAWGLFEKLVIADNLAVIVDKVFSDVHAYSGAPLLFASLCFAFQIYCDFAGYSDIAIGVGRLFGINLTKNFNCPYFSASVQEFWRRWHISLSSWLRDYVYIPLGGNRKGSLKKQLNVLITMLVSGIWHGAAWTFVAWGGVHGLCQVIENLTGINRKENHNKAVKFIRILSVFFIVCVLWIFFRANSFSDAYYVISHMFKGIFHTKQYITHLFDSTLINKTGLAIIFCELLLLFIYDYISLKENVIQKISEKPVLIRWSIYIVFVVLTVFLSYKGEVVKFVYAGF